MLVKLSKYSSFCQYRRSYLIGSPVIEGLLQGAAYCAIYLTGAITRFSGSNIKDSIFALYNEGAEHRRGFRIVHRSGRAKEDGGGGKGRGSGGEGK